jgi:TolA-binding protein
MYWQLTREYPTYPKLPEAFFQMSQNYLVAGHLDTANMILNQLVTRFPNSPRASAAQFRLGELAFMADNYNKAYEHFKKVNQKDIDIVSREMLQYRLGECAYNTGDFDKAVEYFHGYVEACDNNEYKKKEFRDMALEYMAIAFSDMPDGANKAIKFFKKNKGKSYHPAVIYMIGAKNREHGQWDAAIAALESALKNYPTYREAPLASQRLIECYIVKKENVKANRERENLIDNYGEGSKWHAVNSNDPKIINTALDYVNIAQIHFGELAFIDKDYDKAYKRFKMVKEKQVNPEIWNKVQSRLAEIEKLRK